MRATSSSRETATPIEEFRFFTDMLRAKSLETPPLIAIDQEGGPVARLRQGVEPIPSMMAVGATGDLELARRAGEQTAFDLRRAGCTMDFAPVLDLAIDPRNTVIGTRSFGAVPQRVAELGRAFANGLSGGGIVPCFKHFPGHGATSVDSHDALPLLASDESTLLERDLVPFAAVAREASAIHDRTCDRSRDSTRNGPRRSRHASQPSCFARNFALTAC